MLGTYQMFLYSSKADLSQMHRFIANYIPKMAFMLKDTYIFLIDITLAIWVYCLSIWVSRPQRSAIE